MEEDNISTPYGVCHDTKYEGVPTCIHDAYLRGYEAAVIAERVRCLDIVESIGGCSVGLYGYLNPDPHGELVSRSRVETAIRWVKVK